MHTAMTQKEDKVYFVFCEHFLTFPLYKEMPLSVVQKM